MAFYNAKRVVLINKGKNALLEKKSIRIIIDLGEDDTLFDNITYENFHMRGIEIGKGAKNIKVNITNDPVPDKKYNGAITNATEIFDDELEQHPASRTVVEKSLILT